jgi:DNA-binding transcriptional MocR family regulator
LSAIQERHLHLINLINEINQRRILLHAVLRNSGLFNKIVGDSGVFLFARIDSKISSFAAANLLLDKYFIACLPGYSAGYSGEGWLRFCFGSTTIDCINDLGKKLSNVTWPN